MTHKIHNDHQRFKDIVKGHIKKELRKYVSSQDMVISKDGKSVKIPIHQLNIPRFSYGKKEGGIGSGPGNVGDILGDPQTGESKGDKAGEGKGEHGLEVDVEIAEMAAILGEELQLPKIEPKGPPNEEEGKYRYNSIRRHGPEGLRHFRRSYQEALKRQMGEGSYNYEKPSVYPIKEDKRFKSFSEVRLPYHSAVIIFMMDASGSMGRYKDMVRSCCFWLKAWLNYNYTKLSFVYIIHDSEAQEVDEDDFFKITMGGGTLFSSAYELTKKIIYERFDPSNWNIYTFHFTDGDNWNSDIGSAIKTVKEIIPICNQFSYIELGDVSTFGNNFRKQLESECSGDKLVIAEIEDEKRILDGLKQLLAPGN